MVIVLISIFLRVFVLLLQRLYQPRRGEPNGFLTKPLIYPVGETIENKTGTPLSIGRGLVGRFVRSKVKLANKQFRATMEALLNTFLTIMKANFSIPVLSWRGTKPNTLNVPDSLHLS